MTDKHLKKEQQLGPDDPFDAFRSIHFKKDTRTNEEKVKDGVTEAGHETRSVNQVVKLVNMSLSEKVKRLERLKQESKRFDEELNMFTSGLNENPSPSPPYQNPPLTSSGESIQMVSNDLIHLINKYGIDNLTAALDKILSDIKTNQNKT